MKLRVGVTAALCIKEWHMSRLATIEKRISRRSAARHTNAENAKDHIFFVNHEEVLLPEATERFVEFSTSGSMGEDDLEDICVRHDGCRRR